MNIDLLIKSFQSSSILNTGKSWAKGLVASIQRNDEVLKMLL